MAFNTIAGSASEFQKLFVHRPRHRKLKVIPCSVVHAVATASPARPRAQPDNLRKVPSERQCW